MDINFNYVQNKKYISHTLIKNADVQVNLYKILMRICIRYNLYSSTIQVINFSMFCISLKCDKIPACT